MAADFCIKDIEILDCDKWSEDALKILKKGQTYRLCDKSVPRNFFGENIEVSAIVGKNGSGKSSLLEVFYRAINNFAHCMVTSMALNLDPQRPWKSFHHLDYCFGLYVNVNFLCDGENGTIFIRDNIVAFQYGDLKVVFHSVPRERTLNFFYISSITEEEISHEFAGFPVMKSEHFEDYQSIALKLFYSIVTNYAMQSFITYDFTKEDSLWRDDVIRNDLRPDYAHSWIDGLFHKNDGYTTPIVLNPYRGAGKIDMHKESLLTRNRVASLLLFFDHMEGQPQLIDGYDLDSITFNLNPHLVIDKIGDEMMKHIEVPVKKYSGSLFQMEQIASHLSTLLQNEYSLANLIVREYGVKVKIPKSATGVYLHDNPLLLSLIYLVYKTLAIPSRHYPGYEPFAKLSISNICLLKGDENYGLIMRNAKELVKKINSDLTHIGLKIRQTLNSIDLCAKGGMPKGTFDYITYSKILQEKKYDSLSDVIENMPPSYFVPIIQLKTTQKSGISFDSLSSGQRQLIYTISTYIYHSLNILSVEGNDRLSYRNLCFILDEVEICFHPEYQRVFLKRLVDTLIRVELNKKANIHIIIATHSPFILSDIPCGNVLKLEEGLACKKEETFAANIHNLLNNEFFLDYSIGDIAREKIEALFKTARDGVNQQGKASLDEFDYVCNNIGDEYLKRKAKEAFYNILGNDELIRRLNRINREREEIEAILNKRNDEENSL